MTDPVIAAAEGRAIPVLAVTAEAWPALLSDRPAALGRLAEIGGFKAKAGSHSIGALAKELVAIAKDGLSRVAPTALPLLAPVEEIASTGRTQADKILDLWDQHSGSRKQLIRALSHPGLGPK